ncbi:hypothetical protein AAJ76_630009081 [Vairimorpha ceranae]|uniref:Uncharacterized protein n=1 Tax=Vairimorpha ceranae TaxID=40302 RepID=A0A0F9YPD3_9MICR|nr:hypothetical protein AAJ76_630009081 [Vairimorpha ceranae]KAF5139594.1 hypothetical protein G9O61_00g022510 [Vairimorpha ceranae]KKO74522.1 hypothetical protein AAJ76_630009081 [Vairimorpha ceranae]
MSKSNKKKKIFSTEDDETSATLLKSSIQSEDTTYLSEYLMQKNAHRQLKYLEAKDLEKLSLLLVDFLTTPLRLLALDVLKKIANNKVLQALKHRAIDFEKLVYLKGKIDFIKMKNLKNVRHEPETTIN